MIKKLIYLFLGITIGIITTIILFLVVGPLFYKTNEIKVPNVIGLDYVDATNLLMEKGLKYKEIFVSSEFENNIVIETTPKVNEFVKETREITLYISTNEVLMINVVNDYYSQALLKLDKLKEKIDIDVITVEIIDNEVPVDFCIKQYPKENVKLQNGDVVVLYKSLHDNEVLIPNMVGWMIEKVQKFEKENELSFEYEYVDSAFEAGTVLSMSIKPGVKIVKKTKNYVKITVSNGFFDYIPNFVGLTYEKACELAQLYQIELLFEYVESDKKNVVISQEENDNYVKLYISD